MTVLIADARLDDFICVADNGNIRAAKNNGDATFSDLGTVSITVIHCQQYFPC